MKIKNTNMYRYATNHKSHKHSDNMQTTSLKQFSLSNSKKRKRSLPSLSIDMLECIVINGMKCSSFNHTVIILLLTNKELYIRIMQNHQFWFDKFFAWNIGYGKLKPMPNAQLLSKPVLFHPGNWHSILTPDGTGIPEPKQRGFNEMTRRILSLRAQNTCWCCKNTARRTHVYWYLKKRFCELCMPQMFVTDNVLAFEYGLRVNGSVLTRTGETMPFLDAVKGRVYYFYNQYSKSQRVIYTNNFMDLRVKNEAYITYFAREHLEKIIDLCEAKRIFKQKQEAALTLTAYLNPIRLNIHIQGKVIDSQWFKKPKVQKRLENRALRRITELRIKENTLKVQHAQRLTSKPFPVIVYQTPFWLNLIKYRMYVNEDFDKYPFVGY
jgi:hypothetical protein